MDEHEERTTQPQPEPANDANAPEPAPPKTALQNLYDKIPLTYRQADILVKALIVLLVLVLIIGVATGSGIGGSR